MSLHKYGPLASTVLSALNKRGLVLMVALLFVLLGIYGAMNMKIDAVPDISTVQVMVTTDARGLAPREIEQYVTYPVELALQGIPRLTLQRSISKYGLSQVTAVFEDGTDIYWARQLVSERLKTAQEQMPQRSDVKMMLGPIATGLGEIYQFQVAGDGYSLMQLRDILDWQVAQLLKSVPGVDEVQSMGGEVKEYQVWLDPERMHGYKITVQEVLDALSRSNGNAGGGYLLRNSDQILLRADGMLRTTKDIKDVVIRRLASGTIRVSDVGTAVVGKKLNQSIVTMNGKGEAVIGIVLMRKGENSVQLLNRIKARVQAIAPSLPQGVRIVPFYDRSELIDDTIHTVRTNLEHGALLVLLILLLFLGSWRSGSISALAIPLSLLGALCFLSISGVSGNLLSLGALDFGILIDGTVVMVENAVRCLAHNPGRNRLDVIREAAAEVASPVFFAVAIITVVYVPILFLPGVSGKTFQPMALTVIFGLLTALVIALYLTPSLCYVLLEKRPQEKDAPIVGAIRKPYRKALLSCARHPLITGAATLCLFLVSLACLPLLGSEFMPTLKEGGMVLTVNRPVSGSLQAAAEQTLSIERLLLTIPEVEKVLSRTGHSEIAFDPMGPDETDVFVMLKPRGQWRAGITQDNLERTVSTLIRSKIPGAVFSISQPIEQRMNELVAGAKSDVVARLSGPDLDELRRIGAQVANVVAKIPGSADVKLEQTNGLPVLTAKLNQSALAAYGVMKQDALDAVSAAVDGKVVGTIYQGRPRYDLTVRFNPEDVARTSEFGDIPVAMQSGELVPLRQIATLEEADDAAQISHRDGERCYTVQMNVRGRDLGGFVHDAQSKVASAVTMPPGYRIAWGGQFENMQEAQQRLTLLIPLALLIILALLYTLYGEMRPGLLIFANVPIALSGGIFGLMMRGMHVSVTAAVGFIALFGIAVLNGVVLVSCIRDLEKKSGLLPRQAALKAANLRLRPVLMTAAVASFGFVPMAVATSVGAEVQRPLATVVIAGLCTSTLLTLLLLPSIYAKVCGRKRPTAMRNNSPLEIFASGKIRHRRS